MSLVDGFPVTSPTSYKALQVPMTGSPFTEDSIPRENRFHPEGSVTSSTAGPLTAAAVAGAVQGGYTQPGSDDSIHLPHPHRSLSPSLEEDYNSEYSFKSAYAPREPHLSSTRDYERDKFIPISVLENSIVQPLTRLANAFEKSLHANVSHNDMSFSGNASLLNRMTSSKLPTFSGEPLDWLRFKCVYDLSTEMGQYSEQENFVRLYDALVHSR